MAHEACDTTGNITGQSANLAAIANNGGSTLTHAPNSGSPAIDAGHPTVCVPIDQRLYSRPFNGRCDMGAYEFGAQGVVSGSVTFIAYNYDGLYRLTNANYSTGQTFTYTHDAVGNRLTQGALGFTTVYTYDNANRLTQVNGTTYTWDNNGNLLNDGAMTYTYDSANRPMMSNLEIPEPPRLEIH